MDKLLKYTNVSKCRVCGSGALEPVLELGRHPLANSLKTSRDQQEKKYPLTLIFCCNCSLAQLKETVDKEILFKKYIWVTGTSSTAKNFAQTFYKNILAVRELEANDLIVEIASNDGTFLKPFISAGCQGLGVDPAENIAEIANAQGIPTRNAFWCREEAQKIVSEYGNGKVISARNVIAHVSDLEDVISGIHLCLANDGIGAIEYHYAGEILDKLQYDSIYHEHLCYFSIRTIEFLLKRFDLHPFHIELSPISGGAQIIYFSKEKRKPSITYTQLIEKEDALKTNSFSTWNNFANRCIQHKKKSRGLLNSFGNKTIVGFGASARSSTYLNFCDFTDNDIKAIIDNNPLKHGLFSAGPSSPIVSEKEGLDLSPDAIFILAWNFMDEIIQDCKSKGYQGKFLASFPNEPVVIGD